MNCFVDVVVGGVVVDVLFYVVVDLFVCWVGCFC